MADHLTPEDAALLAEADACGRTWGRQVEDMPSLIADLAASLRAALTREAEMQATEVRLRVLARTLTYSLEAAERERDTLRTVYGRESSTRDDAASTVARSSDQAERVKALSTNTSEGKPRTP